MLKSDIWPINFPGCWTGGSQLVWDPLKAIKRTFILPTD